MLTTLILALATPSLPVLDGRRIQAGTTCYTLSRAGKPVGAELHVIRAMRDAKTPAWDIVIDQRVAAFGFALRDHFVVRRSDLRPIRLDSRRGTARTDKTWQQISLTYSPTRITGTRETAAGTAPIDVPLTGPVWEGNLWSATFAALPLRAGGAYTVPFWQYDKGFGDFTVRVVGSEQVGDTDAWIVEAGTDPAKLSRYRIGKRSGADLGYDAGPFVKTVGGDCTGLA